MNDQLWLGTQASFSAYMEATVKAEARRISAGGADCEEEEKASHWMEVHGSVAVIYIRGSLVSGEAGWGRYYGITGYEDLRRAAQLALENTAVKAILLYTTSGGGHVEGCHDTAELFARVDNVKPVITYNGGTMGSACTWLASSAREIYVGSTSISGSIGIIMVHASRYRQLKDDGIDVKVIRAGAEKALATPYEQLSEKAEEVLQAQANFMYDIFIEHVAKSRNVTRALADKNFGQGREFIGQQAVDAGLADKVGSYEDAYLRATALGEKAEKRQQKPRVQTFNTSNSAGLQGNTLTIPLVIVHNPATAQGNSMPTPLSQDQIAALAAAGITVTADASGNMQVQVPAAPAANTPAPVVVPAAAATPAVPATAAVPGAVTVEATLQNMLATTNTQLIEARTQTATLTTELAAANAAKTTMEAQQQPLVEIARGSVKAMGLHFGLTAEGVAAMDAKTVLAEHARLLPLFQDKFKPGAQAASAMDTNTGDGAKPVAIPEQFAARLPQRKS
jgi:signal peptide peptidase SppA